MTQMKPKQLRQRHTPAGARGARRGRTRRQCAERLVRFEEAGSGGLVPVRTGAVGTRRRPTQGVHTVRRLFCGLSNHRGCGHRRRKRGGGTAGDLYSSVDQARGRRPAQGTRTTMQCPICGAPARHLTGDFEGFTVACPRCGNYQVTDSCFNALLRLDLEARREALAAAKRSAAPGAVPTISSLPHRSWWQRLWQ